MMDVMDRSALSFRELLDSPGLIVAPGAYDGITARLVEQAGFPLVYMTGAGRRQRGVSPTTDSSPCPKWSRTPASWPGRFRCRSSPTPTPATATSSMSPAPCRSSRHAGVAGIHLEDQVSPKRCGHLDGKEVVDRTHFTSLVAAAVEARASEEFVIVARTDAVATDGLDEAVDRANAALDAGADVAFVEALTTLNDVAVVPNRVHGPCLLNIVPGGKTPVESLDDVESMGYRMALCPGLLLGCDRPDRRHGVARAGRDETAPVERQGIGRRFLRTVRRCRMGRRRERFATPTSDGRRG